MVISCSINLSSGDHLGMTSDEAAKKILEALGGDLLKDLCNVTILSPPGSAGTDAPPVT